jgi:hypothetical protein
MSARGYFSKPFRGQLDRWNLAGASSPATLHPGRFWVDSGSILGLDSGSILGLVRFPYFSYSPAKIRFGEKKHNLWACLRSKATRVFSFMVENETFENFCDKDPSRAVFKPSP